jgi:hypothetical protein
VILRSDHAPRQRYYAQGDGDARPNELTAQHICKSLRRSKVQLLPVKSTSAHNARTTIFEEGK